jgi:hypothetical protein
MNPYITPLFTAVISMIAALISYFNYRLNKTLNIKNQLFNEKLKKYIELSRKLAELIELLQILGPNANRVFSKTNHKSVVEEQMEKLKAVQQSIEYMIIESYMLVPENIIRLMINFAENQNIGLPDDLSQIDTQAYWDRNFEIREKAENLISAFREDLNVDKLSINLTKRN